ncbi:uncharacterized protein P174DRAFT_439193 [Aspergillus novofumigatus IBT 16806]|uniref:Uncharacterized protein n=1 Tax=Aspergillus novofumigatus (strain IBT 16806) TaxID=1392255 RepID=A0A2I1CIJ3_ASPN1|nr:uncharacterized protein P174DRAFT_439193 [Aspergillus novofumigatus IBT 16806]PKX97414.1 hypothetical protein P174DRAFT_439193 [Aspergillus novofumigatus IBT 16806]
MGLCTSAIPFMSSQATAILSIVIRPIYVNHAHVEYLSTVLVFCLILAMTEMIERSNTSLGLARERVVDHDITLHQRQDSNTSRSTPRPRSAI